MLTKSKISMPEHLRLMETLNYPSLMFNPFVPSGLFYHNSLDWSISSKSGLASYYYHA